MAKHWQTCSESLRSTYRDDDGSKLGSYGWADAPGANGSFATVEARGPHKRMTMQHPTSSAARAWVEEVVLVREALASGPVETVNSRIAAMRGGA